MRPGGSHDQRNAGNAPALNRPRDECINSAVPFAPQHGRDPAGDDESHCTCPQWSDSPLTVTGHARVKRTPCSKAIRSSSRVAIVVKGFVQASLEWVRWCPICCSGFMDCCLSRAIHGCSLLNGRVGRHGDHCAAARRKPQRMRMEAAIMAIPTLMKPNVTRLSCHGCALRPAAVIGDIAAVPRIAARRVTAQLA